MKIMTIKIGDTSTFEVYLLVPGEHFPGFGGSKRGLVVGDTPSLILRHYDHVSGGMFDNEYGAVTEEGWDRVKHLISIGEVLNNV